MVSKVVKEWHEADMQAIAETSDAMWQAKKRGASRSELRALGKEHTMAIERSSISSLPFEEAVRLDSFREGQCKNSKRWEKEDEIAGVGVGGILDQKIGKTFVDFCFEKQELLRQIPGAKPDVQKTLGAKLREINLELRHLKRLAQGLR